MSPLTHLQPSRPRDSRQSRVAGPLRACLRRERCRWRPVDPRGCSAREREETARTVVEGGGWIVQVYSCRWRGEGGGGDDCDSVSTPAPGIIPRLMHVPRGEGWAESEPACIERACFRVLLLLLLLSGRSLARSLASPCRPCFLPSVQRGEGSQARQSSAGTGWSCVVRSGGRACVGVCMRPVIPEESRE